MLASKLSSSVGNNSASANYIEDVFSTYLYTSTSGTNKTISNGIDLSTKGGMVWVKSRTRASTNNYVLDTVRGSSSGNTKALVTNTTAAQSSGPYLDYMTFNTDGFTANAVSGGGELGTNTYYGDFASWTFRKQPKFFDVVTFTTAGDGSATVNHTLGSTPGMVIIKGTSASDWLVYHRSLASTSNYLVLQSTSAVGDYGSSWITTSSTQITFPSGGLLAGGSTYVMYLYAHNAGGFGLTGTDNVISCGDFTQTSSSVNVDVGFEPQWILVKNTDHASTDWWIFDTMRGYAAPTGVANGTGGQANVLWANSVSAESGYSYGGLTSKGFVWASNFAYGTASKYIYIAIRRGPMKVPTDATKVFSPVTWTGTGTTTSITGVGFPPDVALYDRRGGLSAVARINDKLRGADLYLGTTSTAAEVSATQTISAFGQDGVTLGTSSLSSYPNNSGESYINWFFRRAPSFFDEVCYTGTGSATTQKHNLGVVPELVIYKTRNNTQNWTVYLNYDYEMYLNLTFGLQGPGYSGNHGAPTSTTISVDGNSNTSGTTYVAYLFATCAGVSKVGSYTGNGSSQTINCGFTGGARFVLIKRTDSTGDWYVWDTARGIVTANDPHISLNSTTAEVTTDDTIDTASTGFIVNQDAATNVNVSSATYIYLAIA